MSETKISKYRPEHEDNINEVTGLILEIRSKILNPKSNSLAYDRFLSLQRTLNNFKIEFEKYMSDISVQASLE